VIAVAATAMILDAGQTKRTDAKTVVVHLENYMAPGVEEFVVKGLVQKMFASAGVRIWWRAGTPSADELTRERPIVVSFTTNTPAWEHPGALAFAAPYEGTHIRIFCDRVHAAEPAAVPALLAYVLVHEMTHILQGTVRHSDSGIMKAHWEDQDYRAIVCRRLAFTAADIELIHSGLDTRTAHIAGSIHAQGAITDAQPR
jgi:hypothetical protein